MEVTTQSFYHRLDTLFDVEVLRRVREHFDKVEAERQAQVASEREAIALRVGASTDAFRFDPMWYEPWKQLSAAMEAFLAPYCLLLYPAHIRHIKEAGHMVPWHQDAGYMRLLGQRGHSFVVTCFVSLEYDAENAANLEFGAPTNEIYPHVPLGDHGACIVDREFADVERPGVTFGGGLVFNDHTVHRTYVPPGGRIDRRSFEYRLVTPAHTLPNRDYFDLRTRSFVKTDASGGLTQ